LRGAGILLASRLTSKRQGDAERIIPSRHVTENTVIWLCHFVL